jgi:hypothetical protein
VVVTVAWSPQESITIAAAIIKAVTTLSEKTLPVPRLAAMRIAIVIITINQRRHAGEESAECRRGRHPSRKSPGTRDEPVVDTFSQTGVAVIPIN